jgi:hypothetical protein
MQKIPHHTLILFLSFFVCYIAHLAMMTRIVILTGAEPISVEKK